MGFYEAFKVCKFSLIRTNKMTFSNYPYSNLWMSILNYLEIVQK